MSKFEWTLQLKTIWLHAITLKTQFVNMISSKIMYKHTLLLFDSPVVKFWTVVWINKKMGVIGMFEQTWQYKQL